MLAVLKYFANITCAIGSPHRPQHKGLLLFVCLLFKRNVVLGGKHEKLSPFQVRQDLCLTFHLTYDMMFRSRFQLSQAHWTPHTGL